MSRKKGALNKNKKVKPQKEKKQSGRPKGSNKQKQSQKQTVNVTVNNGGDSGDGKKRQVQQIQDLASTIFNPSLVMPTYGVNTRQPVNLPDPESIDFTELITRLTSNKNIAPEPVKTEPIKIKPINVEPVKTEPIKIKPINVEPVETQPIKTKEPKVKIKPSQIEGEYLGDISNIHSKHIDNKKIPKLPIKIKDTEGLGSKIPLSRIGEIAGTVATGALTGGLSLAGEALLTGGLSTITGDALAGSMIGSGVAAGVNDVLGGGQITQLISGVAGGVVARGAISKYRQRQAAQQNQVNETTPLLTGQKLGGNKTGKSNLIPPSPTREQKTNQSLMDMVKDIASRKAKETTQQIQSIGNTLTEGAHDTIAKIKQRFNTESRPERLPNKGTYTRVPTTFEEDYTQPKTSQSEPLPELDFEEEYAKLPPHKKIQRKYVKSLDEHVANITSNTLENALNEVNREDAAANTLQRVMLGRKGRKEYHRQKVIIPQLRKFVAETTPNTSISDTMKRAVSGGEAPAIKKAREQRESNIKKYESALQQYGEPQYLTDLPAPAAKTIKKPSAATIALNKQIEQFSTSAKQLEEAKQLKEARINAVNRIKAAATRKFAQNDLNDLKKELGTAATKIQGAVRNRTAKREMMKQRQTVKEAELKQMEIVKGKQIKANEIITGALKQKAARKQVNEMKMDKLGNILHFKKEASKSTFRNLLKTNDKRLGTRGYAVNVPLSERARIRETVKKDYRTLAKQYSGGMQ